MTRIATEVGTTVRTALKSWSKTMRLVVLALTATCVLYAPVIAPSFSNDGAQPSRCEVPVAGRAV